MRRLLAPVLLLVLTTTTSAPAHSAWLANGSPVCLDPADQSVPAIAPDGLGGAFIAWLDRRNSAPETDVYLQHVTPFGDVMPGWTLDGNPVCTAPGFQEDLVLAPDGTGGVIVLWSDPRSSAGLDLYAQRVTAAGAIAPGWPVNGAPVCLAPDTQDEAQIVPDGVGGAFMIWRDQRKGTTGDHDTYAQHLTAAGAPAPGWPQDGLALDATPATSEDCTLIEDGAGGAFYAYARDSGGSGLALILKRLDTAGAPAPGWPPNGVVVCLAPGARIHPRLAPDGAGGVIAVWADTRADVSGDLYAAHVSAAGVLDPAWPANGAAVSVVPSYQGPPEVVSDGAGGAIVAWSDYRNGLYQIFAQHVSGAGTIAPGWGASGQLACTSPAAQSLGGIVGDGMGGAYIAYQGGVNVGGVVTQHLAASGHPAPGWSDAGSNLRQLPVGGIFSPCIAPTPDGGAIVAWADDRSPGSPFNPPNPYDIYAGRIGGGGPVPVLASLVSTDLEGLRATIVWQLTGAAGMTASVQRSENGRAWSAVGEATADGLERVTYSDDTLLPGHTYRYRLDFVHDGVLAYAPEAIVVVPSATLAIDRIATRASGTIECTVTLASNGPAALELFDVMGRRVASCSVGELGAGEHAVQIEGAPSAPGLVLVRLKQGGTSVQARTFLLR
jgi:hypothetical protein